MCVVRYVLWKSAACDLIQDQYERGLMAASRSKRSESTVEAMWRNLSRARARCVCVHRAVESAAFTGFGRSCVWGAWVGGSLMRETQNTPGRVDGATSVGVAFVGVICTWLCSSLSNFVFFPFLPEWRRGSILSG